MTPGSDAFAGWVRSTEGDEPGPWQAVCRAAERWACWRELIRWEAGWRVEKTVTAGDRHPEDRRKPR